MGSPGPGSPVTGNRIENGDGPGHQEMRSVIAAGPGLVAVGSSRHPQHWMVRSVRIPHVYRSPVEIVVKVLAGTSPWS